MPTFHVAFDESGKMGDSDHVIFAGFMASPSSWEALKADWQAVLRPRNIASFHAKEAFTFGGAWTQFRDDIKTRDAVVMELVQVGCKYAEGASWADLSSKDWKAQSQQIRSQYPKNDLFYVAFERGLMSMLTSTFVQPNDQFTIICDDSDEYSVECLRSYRNLIKRMPNLRGRVSGICFLDDAMYPPLQFADLLAYCLRRQGAPRAKDTELWKRVLDQINVVFSDREQRDVRVK